MTPVHAKWLRLIFQKPGPGEGLDMRARMTWAAVAVTVLALFLAACGQAGRPASTRPRVTMAFCGGSPQARPDVLDVICLTDDITARNLAWTGWGRPVATAAGTAVVDLCAMEDCHTGSYQSAPIVLIASAIRACPRHRRAYSRLQYVFVGRSPFAGLPAGASTRNFMTGPGRVTMPADQTVSVAC
jgi:hypothetical protein